MIITKFKNISKELKQFSADIKKNDKNKLFLWGDMLFSRFIYGSKPSDYLFFEFYNLKHSQRNKFLTQERLKKINKQLNSKDSIKIFGEKHTFNLNPSSLNTVRVNTLVKDEEVVIIGASLRMGRGDIAVDNLASVGVAAAIDVISGKIISPGRDKKNNSYNIHPTKGEKINGFKIKDWDQVVDFAKKAALIYPHSKYIGWDIGISDNGFELIEGNYYSCWQLLQIDQVGRYNLFK